MPKRECVSEHGPSVRHFPARSFPRNVALTDRPCPSMSSPGQSPGSPAPTAGEPSSDAVGPPKGRGEPPGETPASPWRGASPAPRQSYIPVVANDLVLRVSDCRDSRLVGEGLALRAVACAIPDRALDAEPLQVERDHGRADEHTEGRVLAADLDHDAPGVERFLLVSAWRREYQSTGRCPALMPGMSSLSSSHAGRGASPRS